VSNFYQINEDGEIQTRDRLVIKTLISCQKIISIQKLKPLDKILKYDLYYPLTRSSIRMKGTFGQSYNKSKFTKPKGRSVMAKDLRSA